MSKQYFLGEVYNLMCHMTELSQYIRATYDMTHDHQLMHGLYYHVLLACVTELSCRDQLAPTVCAT